MDEIVYTLSRNSATGILKEKIYPRKIARNLYSIFYQEIFVIYQTKMSVMYPDGYRETEGKEEPRYLHMFKKNTTRIG